MMLDEIAHHEGTALSDGERSFTYRELIMAVEEISVQLRTSGAKTIGIAMDNSPLWGALDLAILNARLVCVPLPGFFSPAQLSHVIRDAGIDTVLTDRPEFFRELLGGGTGQLIERRHFFGNYAELRCIGASSKAPSGTAKITYTSGTTGNPKGVCLDILSMERVAKSLLEASCASSGDRYLSVLPLSTLLENIGALYVSLLAGATCYLPPLGQVGLGGTTKLDPAKMARAFERFHASCAILTPQLLGGLVALEQPLPDLRFLAVGGAPVSMRLLEKAVELGFPVFEGYGLSECASVVSLNTKAGHKIGSVGRPLPHVDLKFSEDGEMLVKGALMLGYCQGGVANRNEYWPTGDTGYLDGDGFLHLTGRKKNIFITSFGRNVAPEWVERELTVHPAILQAAVFGEGRPWSVAVIVPRDSALVEDAVGLANEILPDYARIGKWLVSDMPFLPENGQMTANGRLKRDAIWPLYRERIEALYEGEHCEVL